MHERDFAGEFEQIMEAGFPDGESKQFSIADRPTRHKPHDFDEEKWKFICAAANDERIADHYMEDRGDYNFLLVQLAEDYGLSIDEAMEAVHRGLRLVSQVFGDDEA